MLNRSRFAGKTFIIETEARIGNTVIVKKGYSEREKRTILDRYNKASGISVKKFCKQNRISDASFYSWRRKYFPPVDKFKKKAWGFLPISVSEKSIKSEV